MCDLHDAAGACGGRVMGEGDHVKEWMLQVAHGTYALAMMTTRCCVWSSPAGLPPRPARVH